MFFFFRKIVIFLLGFVSRFTGTPDPGNPAETGFLGTLVEYGWWYQQAGSVQVHIRTDPEYAWEVFIWDPVAKTRVSKPCFRADLKSAFELAVHLHHHYSTSQAEPRNEQPLELVNG